MPSSRNNDLTKKEPHTSKESVLAWIILTAVLAPALWIMVTSNHTGEIRSHDGCVVKGTNLRTDRSGTVSVDVYAEGCSNGNPHEKIAYYDGPVYKNISAYEKAHDAKNDDFIMVGRTYNFQTEVYSPLGQDHEAIKVITLVK